jgi:hypothetical protein
MTTLRIHVATEQSFDLALDAPRFVLWRHAAAALLVLDDVDVARVRRALAYVGVGVTPCEDARPEPGALVRAVGTAINPAPLEPDDVDVLEVRRLALADATAEALRRPVPHWPLGANRRARCRALLREAEALFEIRRVAGCSRTPLRRARHVLRPVVFDPAAAPPAILVHAGDAPLTRWIVA